MQYLLSTEFYFIMCVSILNCCYRIKLESDCLILNVRPTLPNLGLLGWGCYYASKPGHERLTCPWTNLNWRSSEMRWVWIFYTHLMWPESPWAMKTTGHDKLGNWEGTTKTDQAKPNKWYANIEWQLTCQAKWFQELK